MLAALAEDEADTVAAAVAAAEEAKRSTTMVKGRRTDWEEKFSSSPLSSEEEGPLPAKKRGERKALIQSIAFGPKHFLEAVVGNLDQVLVDANC